MKFSQRIGKRPATKDLQLESIDDELRIGIWNFIKIFIIDRMSKFSPYGDEAEFTTFCKLLWHKFYKLPIDTIPKNDFEREAIIRQKYFDGEWYDIYDLLEYLIDFNHISDITKEFIIALNHLLEKEFSAYRIIGKRIVPISNKVELDEIEQAFSNINNYTPLRSANIHLANSLEKLSDRKNPDFRNSIKESISAIETTCRILTEESTLGKALHALQSKGIRIDEQLKSGFEKIYAYTNNKESGIRHAIIEDFNNPDFNDAKYMLVVCSAFINYLLGKCSRLEVRLE